MLIHLMQHGACMPKEIDPHQPLSPLGKEVIQKSSKAAQILGLRYELVVASPKVRSLQTAEIMANFTGYPAPRIEVTEAVKAMTPPQATIDFIREYDGLDSIFIAGHLPSLGLVASALLTGGSKLDMRIENGGLMQIDLPPGQDRGVLNWYLNPSQLGHIAKS